MSRSVVALLAAVVALTAASSSAGTEQALLAFARGGNIHTIRADGTGAHLLLRDAYGPSWSPDGSKLAFVSRRTGDEEIYVANANGTGVRRLTVLRGPDLSPAWSSDGRQLAWSRAAEIWTMSLHGSHRRRLVRRTRIWHEHHTPTWYRNRIVYASSRVSAFNTELFAVPARRLTFTKGSDGILGDDSMPDFSPDGRGVVFTSNRDGNGEIYVMNANGSGQKRLTHRKGDDFTPRFSPDGKRVAFVSLPATVVLMNADGTGSRRLGIGVDPDWAPDGRPAAVHSGTTSRRS